ncbi:MAG: A/G-specific adenine glycosylase [Rhodospirillaceae bacterium]|nr:A/G-specific adenine glycosylase [Rhodospirillaceae bacterium]
MDKFPIQLISWFEKFGRHDLPWQKNRTPYSVWVSEVMLQQTQVATVIPFFKRFMRELPTVKSLAAAELDEVLALWAGLGYYARARNLHKAANLLVKDNNGHFPQTVKELMELPGIGRSTAGAIVAIAYNQQASILDGNVKRVLSRYHAVEGWPDKTDVKKKLWGLSEKHTPTDRVAEFTQALMDLGATVCLRTNPRCIECPVNSHCVARQKNLQNTIPGKKPKKKRLSRKICMLLIEDVHKRILLEKRSTNGIWGGLYSLPELSVGQDPVEWCKKTLGLKITSQKVMQKMNHSFTHFDLNIHPLLVRLDDVSCQMVDHDDRLWYNPAEDIQVGVASPVATLLKSLQSTGE